MDERRIPYELAQYTNINISSFEGTFKKISNFLGEQNANKALFLAVFCSFSSMAF
ncbi:hypothetical protein H5R64_04375 [Limosilactobacillus sp. WF-MO7-1]|uniref:Uncharacterized protein n=1 Tax=Limosilactobacillus fastidiosus TaxID=2759855 RepID=A0ABR6E889_9LACO|nr:hypothetical protein [Limosilactobacillus fastidiosus]